MAFRQKTPSRSNGVPKQKDYKKYREQLQYDFNHRCGYCDDIDAPRAERYEIDHFVPQTLDATLKTDYNNLVYACRSCNNSKRVQWPTGDKSRPNDGSCGWIDPCDAKYEEQFERDQYGGIIPTTSIGRWMYDALKLWKPQHEILWCYESIGNAVNEIYSHLDEIHDEKDLKAIIKIQELKEKIFNKLFI